MPLGRAFTSVGKSKNDNDAIGGMAFAAAAGGAALLVEGAGWLVGSVKKKQAKKQKEQKMAESLEMKKEIAEEKLEKMTKKELI